MRARAAVAELLMAHDRVLDRAEGDLEPPDDVRGARQLLVRRRPLGRRQAVDEVERAAVVRERLPVGVDRRGPTGGDERVVRDDVLRAGGLRVVDDLGRIGARREQGVEDLAVEPPPDSHRQARRDRRPGELVAEADVAGLELEERRRSGSSAASVQPGRTASSSDVATRPGTTETSSTSRSDAASSRAARPRTAFATEGGRSSVAREASSSVT